MPPVARSGIVALLAVLSVLAASPNPVGAQITFEQATADLTSPDAATRLRAVQMLKEAAYPEAAPALAKVLTDPQDAVQLEAIAAELNIFLAERIVARKRIGLVIEKRSPILSEPIFAAGPAALGPLPVPLDVLTALRKAASDDNPRVALEALYAFGALADEALARDRRELQRSAGPELAAMIGVPDPARRFAALRVLGRLFERRAGDEAIDQNVGDAVIVALNDKDRAIRGVAMQALGAMRYERSVQALTDLFHHFERGSEAEAALGALARIAHPSSVVLLTTELGSKSPALKASAIEGLVRLGDRAVLASIDGALNAERNDVVRLAGQLAASTYANTSVDPIAEALAKPKLHDQARGYLIELARSRPAILGAQVIDLDPRLRADAVDILGLTRNPAALPAVEPALKDADPQVARAALRAVARLRAAQ